MPPTSHPLSRSVPPRGSGAGGRSFLGAPAGPPNFPGGLRVSTTSSRATLRHVTRCPKCPKCHCNSKHSYLTGRFKVGLLRELNPGPLAPEARIMPLDQTAEWCASLAGCRRGAAKVSSFCTRAPDVGCGLAAPGRRLPSERAAHFTIYAWLLMAGGRGPSTACASKGCSGN